MPKRQRGKQGPLSLEGTGYILGETLLPENTLNNNSEYFSLKRKTNQYFCNKRKEDNLFGLTVLTIFVVRITL